MIGKNFKMAAFPPKLAGPTHIMILKHQGHTSVLHSQAKVAPPQQESEVRPRRTQKELAVSTRWAKQEPAVRPRGTKQEPAVRPRWPLTRISSQDKGDQTEPNSQSHDDLPRISSQTKVDKTRTTVAVQAKVDQRRTRSQAKVVQIKNELSGQGSNNKN